MSIGYVIKQITVYDPAVHDNLAALFDSSKPDALLPLRGGNAGDNSIYDIGEILAKPVKLSFAGDGLENALIQIVATDAISVNALDTLYNSLQQIPLPLPQNPLETDPQFQLQYWNGNGYTNIANSVEGKINAIKIITGATTLFIEFNPVSAGDQ